MIFPCEDRAWDHGRCIASGKHTPALFAFCGRVLSILLDRR